MEERAPFPSTPSQRLQRRSAYVRFAHPAACWALVRALLAALMAQPFILRSVCVKAQLWLRSTSLCFRVTLSRSAVPMMVYSSSPPWQWQASLLCSQRMLLLWAFNPQCRAPLLLQGRFCRTRRSANEITCAFRFRGQNHRFMCVCHVPLGILHKAGSQSAVPAATGCNVYQSSKLPFALSPIYRQTWKAVSRSH